MATTARRRPPRNPAGVTTATAQTTFSELVANASKAKIKITYTQDGDESVTIAQDGEGKTAYGTDGGSTIYSDGDTTVLCDGTGSNATCTESPVGAGVGGSILTGFTAMFAGLSRLNSSAYGGHTSSDTIAGRDAKCITFKASDWAGLARRWGAATSPTQVPRQPSASTRKRASSSSSSRRATVRARTCSSPPKSANRPTPT